MTDYDLTNAYFTALTSLNGDEKIYALDDPSGSPADKYLTPSVLKTYVHYDGWIAAGETWTYASASTFTVSGDVSAKYGPGDKIKLTQTTAKYFYVLSAVYSSPNTTITVTGGSDYTVANAAITAPYYSHACSPVGFPDWFNWTPTLAGWSSNPTDTVYKFRVSDRCVTIMVRQATVGVSNNTITTLTLPITPATVTNARWYSAGIGNDTGSATVIIGEILSNDATMVFKKSPYAAWTNTGNKSVNIVADYQF